MPYQLRFLKSAPMASWLNETSQSLAPLLLSQKNFLSLGTYRREDVRRIWAALTTGLSGFLINRSQCGTSESCDLGLRRAPENTWMHMDRAELMEPHVDRYQFQKGEDLQSAFDKLMNPILKEFPAAALNQEKIEAVLKTFFIPHLFVNQECSYREVCLHSFDMKLAASFVKIPSYPTHATKTGTTR